MAKGTIEGFDDELLAAARDLVARVTEDEGGNPGYPGHGGLLSRTTIKAADRLSVALQKFEGKENG